MNKTQQLYAQAHTLIPGGSQLLSKRPELFLPEQWPAYYGRAQGAEVEDLDGRRYTDVTLFGVGSCPLGFADPDVDAAVIEAVRAGTMCTLNAPEEVALAERLCELHSWADSVRYTRSGGEAMAMAVRIARAASGRSLVAFSGYHGWHDWYLAANLDDQAALDGHLLPNLEPGGVPAELAGSVAPFADQSSFDDVVAKHGKKIGVIVMEPARYGPPPPGYLQHVRRVADELGAVLVLDEITAGFRMAVGGYHLELGVQPDMAVFAKAMSNGYAMAAVIGRDSVMNALQKTFVSSTYWTERVGPTAALATIDKLERLKAPEVLAATGQRMRAGWEQGAEAAGLSIATKGMAPLPSFAIEDPRAKAASTLYTQCMLDEGYLASTAFYASLAHTPEIVDAALAASGRAFTQVARALAEDRVEAELRGPVAYAGLRGPRSR